MKIIKYPAKKEWSDIVDRPKMDTSSLMSVVTKVLDDVRENGDNAIRRYEEKFDHVYLDDLSVAMEDIDEAEQMMDKDLKESLLLAYSNIKKFHESQRFDSHQVTTCEGVTCWQKSVAIEKVGLYIPGGTAPLFSTVLMLATPAMIAGCREIVLCTPPNRQGKVHPAILMAARIAGVGKIFKVGGVQAIGAMAFGTETIPKVYKIFGPGNQYVMAAKQQVSLHDVAIDMPAGPSEVCVIADQSSNPSFVAADLLSQAEHGTDSQAVMITDSEDILQKVKSEVDRQLNDLPRKEIAAKALDNSMLILVSNKTEAMELTNAYAPEHLIIATEDYDQLSAGVVNAGSVFLGSYACESAGDYASGTNHTLPTHGYALAYNGVNLDSFCRKITFQHLSEKGVMAIGRAVEIMADNEQLFAHKNAMTLRIREIEGNPQ